MKPRAVLLAAGASRRLGEPKALAALSDDPADTPLARLARAAREGLGEAPLVVTGAHHELLAAAAPELSLLHNRDWSRGRTGGVALAAAHLAGRDLLLLPVDVPRIPGALVLELVRAWAAAGAPARGWLAPWTGATGAPDAPRRYGHPVLVGRELLRELAAFDPDQPLSELRAGADPLLGLETRLAEILEDLDSPADLARMRAAREPE